MQEFRIQLGFDLDPYLEVFSSIVVDKNSSTALSNVVSTGLGALEGGADFLSMTLAESSFSQKVASTLASLCQQRLLIKTKADSSLISKATQLHAAQLCIVPLQDISDLPLVEDCPLDDTEELLVELAASSSQLVEHLPTNVAGVCVDASDWANCHDSEREEKLDQLKSLIEALSENDFFVHLINLPTLLDAEEAASLPGVAAIEVGAGILPRILQHGMTPALESLLSRLVSAQEAGLAVALEEHEHHHHDHDDDCGCHH